MQCECFYKLLATTRADFSRAVGEHNHELISSLLQASWSSNTSTAYDHMNATSAALHVERASHILLRGDGADQSEGAHSCSRVEQVLAWMRDYMNRLRHKLATGANGDGALSSHQDDDTNCSASPRRGQHALQAPVGDQDDEQQPEPSLHHDYERDELFVTVDDNNNNSSSRLEASISNINIGLLASDIICDHRLALISIQGHKFRRSFGGMRFECLWAPWGTHSREPLDYMLANHATELLHYVEHLRLTSRRRLNWFLRFVPDIYKQISEQLQQELQATQAEPDSTQ